MQEPKEIISPNYPEYNIDKGFRCNYNISVMNLGKRVYLEYTQFELCGFYDFFYVSKHLIHLLELVKQKLVVKCFYG